MRLQALDGAVFGASSEAVVFERSTWQRVLRIFALFPIEYSSPKPLRGSLRGVMTVVGLPLPNALSAASQLPSAVCRAALAAVARLSASVALELRVTLPHPLRTDGRDGAAVVDDRPAPPAHRYKLLPPRARDEADDFATALQLLQNDVTHLCVKAGAPPDALWPAEALLLNLATLRDAAHANVAAEYSRGDDDDAPADGRRDGDDPESPDVSRVLGAPSPTTFVPPPSPIERATSAFSNATSDNDDADDWLMVGTLPFAGLADDRRS